MRGSARKDDRTDGICYHPSHIVPNPTGGTITSASTSVFVNGKGVARLGDEVTTDCGHKDTIKTASGDTYADGIRTARLNDEVGQNGIYIATIISVSTDVANNLL
jgi:uncharacterized Zn-binding protein involved in type VI secretion